MPRKKVVRQTSLKDWDEVNATLREMVVAQSAIEARINKYNEDEAKRRENLDAYVTPLKGDLKESEENIKLFCEEHREDFGKKRSKELSNGTVSYRTGTPKVKALKGFTMKAALALVKKSVLKKDLVRTKEELDKEQILSMHQEYKTKSEEKIALFDNQLAEVGLAVVQDETFGYELNMAVPEAGKEVA